MYRNNLNYHKGAHVLLNQDVFYTVDNYKFHSLQHQYQAENVFKRSLFGAHLDDFSIEFCHKTSRAFASRGQQKLIIMLIKIAQMQEIIAKNGPTLFLLDDFMTDFDQQKGTILLSHMLELKSQLIFTSPVSSGYFEEFLHNHGAQRIILTP